MASIELAPEVPQDFERFFDHVARSESKDQNARIAEIVQAIQILTSSPLIGHPVKGGRRELVIGRGARGCVVLYRFVARIDIAFVLAIRSQRELGFRHER